MVPRTKSDGAQIQELWCPKVWAKTKNDGYQTVPETKDDSAQNEKSEAAKGSVTDSPRPREEEL